MWGRLQSAEGFSPTFFGFVYGHAAVLKPKKFVAYRIQRPEGRLRARLPASRKAKAVVGRC
jgi:hypothetical protein